MKILLAIDDSRHSEAAVRSVAERPWPPGTEVKVIHVVEFATSALARGDLWPTPPVDLSQLRQVEVERAKRLVEKAADDLRAKSLPVTTEVLEGNPKSRVLHVVEEWEPDLLVLGSHGRTGLTRFFLGSVSEALARHARCSVEIVKLKGPTVE